MHETTAKSAHALREVVRESMAQERRTWAPMAAALHTIHEHEVWRELAADTFAEWLAQEDIGRSRGYLLVAVWDLFSDYELDGRELSKFVWLIGPVRRGEVSHEDALADMEVLSRSDLRAKYGISHEQEDEEVALCPTCSRPLPR